MGDLLQWGSNLTAALFIAVLVQLLLKKIIKNRLGLWGLTLLALLGALGGFHYLTGLYQKRQLGQRMADYHTELQLLRCEFDRLEFFDCARLDSLSVSDRFHLAGLQRRLPGFISRLESENDARLPVGICIYKYDLLALATALRAEINCGPAAQQRALLEACKDHLREMESAIAEVRRLAKTDTRYQPLLDWLETRYIQDQMHATWVWALSLEAMLDDTVTGDEAQQIEAHLRQIQKAYLDIYPLKKIPAVQKIHFLSDKY
ncbi:MAG: hypothetical protein Kow0037_14700 [Calditrichia bacterium]